MSAARHRAHDAGLPLLSRPMAAIMVAQFLSAFADNALLITALALLKQNNSADLAPLLQASFVLPYILLAPFVGPFADSLPKGRVMFIGNGVKLIGTAGIFAGLSPLAGYGIAGLGAAIYSPAKYGILTQLFHPQLLVKANGMLEGSTIVAILTGVLAGGALADYSLTVALMTVTAIYCAAALANLFIPRLPPEASLRGVSPAQLVQDVKQAFSTLFGLSDTRFSMLGTGIFWGAGTSLRLLLFAWVPIALGISDNSTPANLMGVLSLGIVAGAVIAGAYIPLAQVKRALLGGFALGPLVMLLSVMQDMGATIAILALIGAAGGAFVVPLNALLQEIGHQTVGAGRAVAVQNLVENTAMLLFVGVYWLGTQAGLTPVPLVLSFGLVIAVGIALVAAFHRNPGGGVRRVM